MGAARRLEEDAVELAHRALASVIREAVAAGVKPTVPESLAARPRLRVVEVVRSATGIRTREAKRSATPAMDAEVAGAADVADRCASAHGRS